MTKDLYVRRLQLWMNPEWLGECEKAGINPNIPIKVDGICEGMKSYAFRGLPKFWESDRFEIIKDHYPMRNTDQKQNAVINPNHYDMMGANTIEILAAAMTKKEWRGFCLGNTLKYRIRAGKKDDLKQDIDKANNYERLYEEHKHLCRKGKKKSKE